MGEASYLTDKYHKGKVRQDAIPLRIALNDAGSLALGPLLPQRRLIHYLPRQIPQGHETR
jgi:hypothetical protein